jgi:hypothetical protein
MRWTVLIGCLAAAAPATPETPADLRELARAALTRLVIQGRAAFDDHAFVQYTERTELLSDGKAGRKQTWIFRREPVEGFLLTRLVERDGKPVSQEETRKRVRELKALSPAELEKRRIDRLKKEQEEEGWLVELADAMEWRLAGQETVRGRQAWILECTPRPGYHPRNLRARLFEKTRGRLVIDQAEQEMVRAEGETFDSISMGWGLLAKIEKGTKFYFDRARMGDDTWLPQLRIIRFAARVMLFKQARNEFVTRFTEYRRPDAASVAAANR